MSARTEPRFGPKSRGSHVACGARSKSFVGVDGEPGMPAMISLLLAAAPLLALSMLDDALWGPATRVGAQLALAAAVAILILWVVLDALQTLRQKWSRFISRPY